MFDFLKRTSTKKSFLLGILTCLLISCGKEAVNHSKYIPINSSAVLSLNTGEIFSDAFFDLIANNHLTDDLATGPLSGIIKDPANAGIQRLTKYHFFNEGSSFSEGKMGAILPLNDKELLAAYIEKNFPESEVLRTNGFLIAEISSEHCLVWDDQTAIYNYSNAGGDLVEYAKGLFNQTIEKSLASSDSTFRYALRNTAHVSLWINNDEFMALVDDGIKMLNDFNIFESIELKKEDRTGSKSVFLGNFNDGNISINHRQYLNPSQMKVYNGFNKKNKVSSLAGIVGVSEPLALVSASLKSEGLIEMLKAYQVDKAWDNIMAHSPLKLKMEQLAQLFEGDVLISVNGMDAVKKTVKTVDMDDEGNDVIVDMDIDKKIPQINLAMSLKDQNNFSGILNLLISALPKVDGFSSFNDLFYFSLKENQFLATSTPQGIASLKAMAGKLSPELDTLVTQHRTASFLNFNEILDGLKGEVAVPLSSFGNLKNFVFSEKGVQAEGVIEDETVINFNNNDNGLISSIKFLSGLGKIIQPFMML